ncbi:hypothetical protein SMICM304S_05958 [Streptomyces microflavus]
MLAAARPGAGRSGPGGGTVLEETAECLGAGLADLVNLFQPERILVGGWAGLQLGPHLLPEIRSKLARANEYALRHAAALTTRHIEMGRLGPDAVTVGAATLPLADFLTRGDNPSRLRGLGAPADRRSSVMSAFIALAESALHRNCPLPPARRARGDEDALPRTRAESGHTPHRRRRQRHRRHFPAISLRTALRVARPAGVLQRQRQLSHGRNGCTHTSPAGINRASLTGDRGRRGHSTPAHHGGLRGCRVGGRLGEGRRL